MSIDELAAREAIRDLVARYNALGDAGRVDALAALFAEDAVLELEPGGAHRGRDAIRTLFARAATPDAGHDAPVRIAHHVATHTIVLDGPHRAHGRAYFQVLTARGLDHWGRYRDEYRRQVATDGGSADGAAGRWLFARRRVVVDGVVPGGWGAHRLAPGT